MTDKLLLRAYPHQWGTGAIHLIDEEQERTLCGKRAESCPGEKFRGPIDEITCKGCLRSIQAKIDQKLREAQWKQELEQRKELEAEASRLWWAAYERYLQSGTWHEKRRRVLEREHHLCQGCLKALAVQAHHTYYPHGCLPGSPKWIAEEKLFHLIALCAQCHNDVHLADAHPSPTTEIPDHLSMIREKLREAQITEVQLISFLSDCGVVANDTTPLNEVNTKWLRMMLDDWQSMFETITDFLKAHEQS